MSESGSRDASGWGAMQVDPVGTGPDFRRRRISLVTSPPDARLSLAKLLPVYLRHGVIPFRRIGDGIALAAIDHRGALDAIRAFGDLHRVRDIVLCDRTELDAVFCRVFGPALTRHATQGMRQRLPLASARTPLPLWMKSFILLIPTLMIAAFFLLGPAAVYPICLAFLPYCIGAAVLRLILWRGAIGGTESEAVPTARTPMVSILVPVYREAGSLPILIDALENLRYPFHALDVLFLLEADDRETIEAIEALDLPRFSRVLLIPPSEPRTKPKALNFALPFARGEVVAIFDAEDCPEPDQITKAVAALSEGGPGVACAQARLNHYNAGETWISRCAAMEYALWFDLLLKGLGSLRLPVPLGGTSLYIRTSVLRLVAAWDPDNVTEDADLGLRLARRGWRTVVFDSTTHEEATTSVRSWIRQRSRWIKGFLLTWAVHMRQPRALLRDLGWSGFLATNIMLFDGFMAFFAQPFFLAMLVLPWTGIAPVPGWLTGGTGLTIIALFLAGQLSLFALAASATRRRFGWRCVPWVPSLWFYWLLGGIAAFRAVRQIVTRPQYWEKTDHCVSTVALARRRSVVGDTEPDLFR